MVIAQSAKGVPTTKTSGVVREAGQAFRNELRDFIDIMARPRFRVAARLRLNAVFGGVGLSPHASRNPDASRRRAPQLVELFPVFGRHRDASTLTVRPPPVPFGHPAPSRRPPHGITAPELSYARVQSASLLENARDSCSGLHQDG